MTLLRTFYEAIKIGNLNLVLRVSQFFKRLNCYENREIVMAIEINELIKKAAQAFKEAGAREVYLFGSAVKRTLREDSDIDFAVSGLPPEKFFQAMGQVTDILQRDIDLVDLDEVNPFTQYLREEEELQRVG